MIRVYSALAAFGFAVLAFAAVWLGGLNQDEGWYLYAAQLVADGQIPYRDFFYTQAPLMPLVYSVFAGVWETWGLVGARVLTLAFGSIGIVFAAALARSLVPEGRRGLASLLVILMLGGNLYHLYYVTIPKTYALASVCATAGFCVLLSERRRGLSAFASGILLAMAAGTRISLGVLLVVAGVWLLVRGERLRWLWFALGGALALALIYGPPLAFERSRAGLAAAQAYHAARGGFDVVFTVGSLSRLVRWYLPVFVMLGIGVWAKAFRAPGPGLLLAGFGAVFFVQMLAPFPYEDYQVPVMGLLTAAAAAMAVRGAETPRTVSLLPLLAIGMTWAGSFGSPLLQEWMIDGQDRFWSIKKQKCEMAQLREVAREIEALDPGGKTLLTQDLYLAVETGRRVPRQLAMGPFSYWGESLPYPGAEETALDDEGMRALLDGAPCEIAAMSGYSFAITVPRCDETPFEKQMEFWSMLKKRYELVFRECGFGQNSTTLLVLKRRQE